MKYESKEDALNSYVVVDVKDGHYIYDRSNIEFKKGYSLPTKVFKGNLSSFLDIDDEFAYNCGEYYIYKSYDAHDNLIIYR